MEKLKDIFISYKNDGEGNHFAARLCEDLKHEGYSVYFNPDEGKTGNFPERLRKAIYACKDFVCIVTRGYMDDLKENTDDVCWIRDELLCAKKYARHIVPILVNGASMPKNKLDMPENLRFFPDIDAFTFPEQYLISPFTMLTDALISVNNGTDDYRDVQCSNILIDPEQYISQIEEQAKSGDVEAMYKAGMLFFHGIGGPRDFKKAAKWLKQVSETDHKLSVYANTLIARMYYSGSMPREEQSYEKSFEYHKKAEEDPYSAAQVAFMQRIGSGCKYDFQIIEDYYLKIIDSNDAMCKMGLADFYELHGQFQKAAKIYQDLADTVPDAAYKLGMMYKNGILSTPPMPDYRKAATYLKMASDQGNVNAAFEYGVLHFNPTGNLKKNFREAQQYFEKAADAGHMEAQYILGYMYEYGHVEKNYLKAIHYFQKAVDQGHVFSGMHLAVLYQQPEIHNYQKAFQNCYFSAEHGCGLACFYLGNMYLFGCGCESDEDKAFLYYRRAAEMGIYEAKVMMWEAEKLYDE